MAGRPAGSTGTGGGVGGAEAKQLVQLLRSDLNSLSNEAKKKYPAVREASERSAMRLKTLSESREFSIEVLASTADVVHPLLFACQTRNPVIVKIALSSVQKLIQYKAIPQMSVVSIVSTLGVLMESGVEELKVLQTILLLVTTTDVVQGKPLAKVLLLCFKLYRSRESSVHNTAGVVIRQIVSSVFERLYPFINKSGSFDWGDEQGVGHGQLPVQASDAYLLFHDICFLTNGDPPAWLPTSLDLELTLGLELLETVLRTHPKVFIKEKLFSQLLTERVCPLVVKLFSPSSKYCNPPTPATFSPSTAAMLSADKPTFGLSVRLLRILNVLIREFYSSLVTQCEIFLSMLVKFLDPDKPMWQRTVAVEVLHAFCNQPDLLRSFCVSYDMQEHSSRIFGDIVDALGSFIQSCVTSHATTHLPFSIVALSSSSSAPMGGVGGSNSGHVTGSGTVSGRHLHQFTLRNTVLHVEPLSPNAYAKPICLEMLDKSEVPPIPEGYPLVVAMNALFDAVKSVSSIINGKEVSSGNGKLKRKKSLTFAFAMTTEEGRGVAGVMLHSSWSGVLAALALLLDSCMDERTISKILQAHQTFILLCGQLQMMAPRDAFLTSLCKGTLPPRYTMSLITQRKAGLVAGGAATKVTTVATTSAGPIPIDKEMGIPHHMIPATMLSSSTLASSSSPHPPKQSHRHIMVTNATSHDQQHHLVQQVQDADLLSSSPGGGSTDSPTSGGGGGFRRKLNLGEGGGVINEGVGVTGGMVPNPVKEQSVQWQVTVKNLQCIHTLLQIVHYQGNLLDSTWFLVMNTLQLIVEIFGLVPQPGGGYKQINFAENPSLVCVKVCKKDEITDLTEKLKQVTKSSNQLTDDSVLKLVDALSQLMFTSLPGPGTKDTALFPVVALQEVGVANISRLDIIWRPITSHLSKACCQSDVNLRTFATDALTSLIRVALLNKTNEENQLVILSPLKSLVAAPYVDVRQKQLDCVSQVLHSSGQRLRSSWSVILDVICSATQIQSETLVRSGFQSLQLVIADFLPAIPHTYVSVCVDVSGQYSLQTVDINISLTSIGLLWNMADYLFQNKDFLKDSLSHDVFDTVWMLLFRHLSNLCVDERAAVRKSACQTLFSTISAHGSLLQKQTWKDVLWKILFPLLEGVSQATGAASTSSFQTSLLIHHSRNSEQKQWAETQVLTLTGSARLLQSRWSVLSELDGFIEAWTRFLDIVKECSCSTTTEVSIAAMKSFRIIVDPYSSSSSLSSHCSPTKEHTLETRKSTSPSPTSSLNVSLVGTQHDEEKQTCLMSLWNMAWDTWTAVGENLVLRHTLDASQLQDVLQSNGPEEMVHSLVDAIPSQAVLVCLLEVVLQIYPHIWSTFTTVQFQTLSNILHGCLLIPVPKDVSPFLVPSHSENSLTSMQRLVLRCVWGVVTSENIMKSCDSDGDHSGDQMREGKLVHTMFGRKKSDYINSSCLVKLTIDPGSPLVSLVLSDLLSYASYTHTEPDSNLFVKELPSIKHQLMQVNFVPFGLSCQCLMVQLYRTCVKAWSATQLPANIHVNIMQALHSFLQCRYSNEQQQLPNVWLQTVEALLLVLHDALPLNLGQVYYLSDGVKACLESLWNVYRQAAKKCRYGEAVANFWENLGAILDDVLFSKIPDGVYLSSEKMKENEEWDIKVIEMIKKDILSAPTPPPRKFLVRLAFLLNKGSIHANTDQLDGDQSQLCPALQLRENFARACFEALLQFSFMHNKDSTLAAHPAGQLALNALLERCEEVLVRFVVDERLSGACPLPRTRMNEVSLVLKSVSILISALKEAQRNPSSQVDSSMWTYVSKLYPALVQCVTCKSHDIRIALRDALSQFTEFLQPNVPHQ